VTTHNVKQIHFDSGI